jgi:hypothetical protein
MSIANVSSARLKPMERPHSLRLLIITLVINCYVSTTGGSEAAPLSKLGQLLVSFEEE